MSSYRYFSEGPTVDGLVPFRFVVEAVFLQHEKRDCTGLVLDA